MFKDSYQNYQEEIKPERELIKKTKEKMRVEQLKQSKGASFHHRHILAATAIVTILIVATVWQNPFGDFSLPSSENKGNHNMVGIDKSQDIEIKSDVVTSVDTDQKAENEIEPVFLTKEESYSQTVYGKYLPKTIPEGYQFEEGVIYSKNTAEEKFSFLYTKEFGEIRVSISRRDIVTDYEERVVKASEPDSYNIAKYSIPYSETIPDELFLSMRYPIFDGMEVTPKVIESRKEIHSEQGEKNQTSIIYRFAAEWQDYIIEYYVKSEKLGAQDVFNIISSAEIYKE